MRINKYIAALTKYSRRQVDELITKGKVKVNDVVLGKNDLGRQVSDSDQVFLEKKLLKAVEVKKIYLALNKPRNFVTTAIRQKDQRIVMDLIPTNLKIFPVGRLDKNSCGLLIFTNDGELANELTHPKFAHEKEYVVKTKETITDQQLKELQKGIKLDEGLAKAKKIVKRNQLELNIILTTGFKRQVRRMLEAVGNKVSHLQRIRINRLKLEDLPLGKWKYINKKDIVR
ncbi:MAG: pseudouridine synthase [Patescibacteria group bacterium]